MTDEMRVRIESTRPADGELRFAWFTLPVYEEELEGMLGVDAESEDYRIVEKELPFSDEVGEDTTLERLNDLYSTFQSLPADLKEDYGELMCHFTSLDELHQHRNDLIHYPLFMVQEHDRRCPSYLRQRPSLFFYQREPCPLL